MAGIERATAIGRTRQAPVPPAVRRRLDERLRQVREDFDKLEYEVGCGIRNAAHYDQLEEQADGIARGIHIAFRGDRG